MNKIKSLCVMVLLVLSMLAVSGIASATITINTIKVDGTAFDNELDCGIDNDCVLTLDVEKDSELEVKVTSTSNELVEDVQMSAYIRGNHRDLVEDTSDTFDMKANVSYVRKLTLDLPQRMEQGTYTLYVRVEGKDGSTAMEELTFALEVDTADHAVQIRDITLSPENYVKAGRALLTTVRIKNRGEWDEEDVKVKVSMPELGISASDYIDELDAECDDDDDCDDSTTSEELYMRIPDCAQPGEYTVKVCVEYDDGDEEECDTTSIDVVEGDLCPAIKEPECPFPGCGPSPESKTIITIGPEAQEIEAGASASYSVTLTNQGSESKSYSVSADVGSWATASITPTNVVVLSPGESKSVFVNLAADDSAAGEQMFSVTISSGSTVLKQVPLKASVEKASAGLTSSIKRGLEIGLVILVVLLVVLGLIIGFNKLKGSDEEKDEKEETYY